MAIHRRIRKAARNLLAHDRNTAREFAHVYKDAEKVEGSLEIRKLIGRTTDWLRSLPPSESTAA
jgi:hypothetical protein